MTVYYPFPGHSMDIQEKVSHLREKSASLVKVSGQLDANHYSGERSLLRELAGLYESFGGALELLAKRLPFKKGDRVRLVKAPKCDDGWSHCKHFLVEGATGTVAVVATNYLMQSWHVDVVFDDESWICSFDHKDHETGKLLKVGDVIKTPPDRRHLFGFHPDHLAKIDAPTPLSWPWSAVRQDDFARSG